MANKAVKVKAKDRLMGVEIVAEELGVRREWIWAVRTGRGTSARVEEALRRHGIHCKRRTR